MHSTYSTTTHSLEQYCYMPFACLYTAFTDDVGPQVESIPLPAMGCPKVETLYFGKKKPTPKVESLYIGKKKPTPKVESLYIGTYKINEFNFN